MINDVKIEFTKAGLGARRDPLETFRKTGGAVAFALAGAIKKRVMKRGDLAGQSAPAYSTKHPRAVDPRYPVSGGELTESGFRLFENSADLHSGTRRGSYNVTGGMWSGLSVIVSGKTATIRFRGRSFGQRVVTSEGRRKKAFRGGSLGRVMRRQKPSNALKAATVFRSHNISLLALAEREVSAILEGMLGSAIENLVALGPAAIEWTGGPPSGLIQREIMRRMR